MTVERYIFQSPYHSSVQFGRPDPSTKQEESTQEKPKTQMTAVQSKTPTEIMQKTVVEPIKPTVSEYSLDIYA